MAKLQMTYHEIKNADITGVKIELIDDAGVTLNSYSNFQEYENEQEDEDSVWANQTETFEITDDVLASVKSIIESNPAYEKYE